METTTKMPALSLYLRTDPHASPEWPPWGTLCSPQGTMSYKTIKLCSFSPDPQLASPYLTQGHMVEVRLDKEAIQKLSLMSNVWWLLTADQNLKKPTGEVLPSQKGVTQHAGLEK